jgi:AcrR family transcriptional regulator
MARPRTPLLSREKIVAEALALIDAEGLAALSTRRLAGRLGVSGPSLYNHFATMDELVEAVADTVIAKVDLDGLAEPGLPWPRRCAAGPARTGTCWPSTRTWCRSRCTVRGAGRPRSGRPTPSTGRPCAPAGRRARRPRSAR